MSLVYPLKQLDYYRWQLSTGNELNVKPSVINKMLRYRQTSPLTPESGGLLIGRYHGPHIVITDATSPMKGDKCSRNSFVRNDPSHINYAKFLHSVSDQIVHCVGEWHTHPEDVPRPSLVDTQGWKRFGRGIEPRMYVFLIQGLKLITACEYTSY